MTDIRRHKPTICFLSSRHPPFDKRVFDKEAISLAKAGFSVIHLTPGDGRRTRREGVEVATYRYPSRLVERLFSLPRLYRVATTVEADCYHCNEVDSWLVGILMKLRFGSRVVFDVHEHYPSTVAERYFPSWMQPFIAAIVRLLFRLLTPLTDRLVFAKRSVAPDFPRSEQKQVFVLNFTSLAYQDDELDPQAAHILTTTHTGVTAIHLGLISRLRGWPELLDALTLVRSKNLHVHIVGTFHDGSHRAFEEQLAELGLTGRVSSEEWMPFEQAYQRVLASDIGLVLFQPGVQNHVYALPHKLFDYMLARLPVIAPSFAEEVAPIIRETNCGLLVDPSSPVEIAEALDHLAMNEEERRRLGENGRQAVISRYNWEREAAKLIEMYSELLEEDI